MSAKTLLTALAALTAAGFAASAHATPAESLSFDPETVAVKVDISDLNLRSEAGAKAVLQRIRNAARDICGEPESRLLDRNALYRACTKVTVDHAVASLDNPIVTALNAGRGRPATILAARR